MKRFLGISLVCLSAAFVVGCDNGSEGPSEQVNISAEEQQQVDAYTKSQLQNPPQ